MSVFKDASSRSPKLERAGIATRNLRHHRRPTQASPNSESFTAEIARLTAARADLVAKLAELPDQGEQGWMYKRERAALASRLRRVDMKLFAFRQFVFLFGDI